MPNIRRQFIKQKILTALAQRFFQGVIVLAPIGVTIWVVVSLFNWVDNFLPNLLNFIFPQQFAEVNGHIPKVTGLGFLFAIVLVLLVGWLSSLFFVERFMSFFDKILERTPGIKIGKIGIEKILNRELIGTPGFTRFEVNAAGRAVRTVEFVDGVSGNALKTSLDLELQKLTYQKLGRYAGSAIAMDIKTGEVLACVSTPSFDTNKFAFGITQPEFNELLKNERRPLINKFLSGQYPPGSVIKPIIALAALENKIVDQDYTHFCPGKIELYGQEFYCWKDGGHGRVNLKDAIKKSCDIYFYEVARLLGVDRLAETIRKFNFGQTILKDFDEERKGLVPDTKWKKNALGKPWLLGETLITGIGQGYILATPMQICKSMAQFANGGYVVNPTFYLDEKSKLSRMDFDVDNIKIINEALVAATNEPGGTSYGSRLNGKLKFAGKTGTSQVTKLTIKDREDNANPNAREYKYRDHSLFAGFGPVEEPKYAVAVVAEHSGPGSRIAAPIASSMFDFLFKKRISNA